MGDNMAVEIAQQAHSNVLRFLCGALKSNETLRYRVAVPRTDFVELLAIDDHVGIQRLPISQIREKPSLRDTKIFEKAAVAYKAVGLIQQEKKQRRNETSGVILGADFDGLAGKVMAPRSRVALLSLITMIVVYKGTCTNRLLSMIIGCWIHVLLFRRPLFAIMSHVFNEGKGKSQDQVFCLQRQSLCELQLLATFGSMAQSDLRAKHDSRVYCTDASPSGGAVCYAELGKHASKEFWRHTEQRGFYTKLLNPVSATLVEQGIDEVGSRTFATEPLQSAMDCNPTSFNIPPPNHRRDCF